MPTLYKVNTKRIVFTETVCDKYSPSELWIEGKRRDRSGTNTFYVETLDEVQNLLTDALADHRAEELYTLNQKYKDLEHGVEQTIMQRKTKFNRL